VTRNGLPTTYQNIEILTISTLGETDTITVNAAVAGFPETVNVNSGDGDDTITVNLMADVTTTVNLDGGAPSASDSVIINGTTGADTIGVDGLNVVFDKTLISLSGVENLTVAGGDSNDNLSLTGQSVAGMLMLQGEGGDDAITLDYSIATGHLVADGGAGTNNALVVNTTDDEDIVSVSGAEVQITGQPVANYSNFGTLTVNTAGGADTITIVDTHEGTTTLSTGTEGDTLTIQATSGELNAITDWGDDIANIQGIGAAVTFNGGGDDDTINVFSDASTNPGTLNGINRMLTIYGDQGDDSLVLADVGDIAPNTGALTDTQVTGLGMAEGITYFGLEALKIFLGSGKDTFTIQDTHDGATTLDASAGDDIIDVQWINGDTAINTGEGSDTIDVTLVPLTGQSNNSFSALLTVDGGDDSDTLNVDGTGYPLERAGTLTSARLTGLGMAEGITYGSLEHLNIGLGLGDDTFTIQGTHSGTTTLTTHAGSDNVHIQNTAGLTTVNTSAGDDIVQIEDIHGETTVNSADGSDTVNVLTAHAPATINAGRGHCRGYKHRLPHNRCRRHRCPTLHRHQGIIFPRSCQKR